MGEKDLVCRPTSPASCCPGRGRGASRQSSCIYRNHVEFDAPFWQGLMGCRTWFAKSDAQDASMHPSVLWVRLDRLWFKKFRLEVPVVLLCSRVGLAPVKKSWGCFRGWSSDIIVRFTVRSIYLRPQKWGFIPCSVTGLGDYFEQVTSALKFPCPVTDRASAIGFSYCFRINTVILIDG